MKKIVFLFAAVSMLTFSSCSKSESKGTTVNTACFADQFTLTQTDLKIYPDSHDLFITLDVKNTSASEFDIQKGAKAVNLKIIVMTTDGNKYETNTLLTVTKLSAGATTSVLTTAGFGTGKTYKSYTIEKSCN